MGKDLGVACGHVYEIKNYKWQVNANDGEPCVKRF
jgi:hypothetical protein